MALLDIYICNTIYKDSLRRRNILYINQGIDKEGIPHFKDMAAEYGLDIHVQSTMASFLIMITTETSTCILPLMKLQMDTIRLFLRNAMKAPALVKTGVRLFRNDMDPVLKHRCFS